jgi:ketosteroid isomerase-like protein
MPDRDQLLSNIDAAYAARIRGDKAALGAHFAPGATFRLAGNAGLVRGDLPVATSDAEKAVSDLIDLFQFHDIERLDAVVDGDSAAVRWRLSVSTGGAPPVETEVYDLWKFDGEGRAVSLTQFADTALIAHMLQGTKAPV